jgi:hypothetical protein
MRRAVLSAVAAGVSAAALLMTGIAAAAVSPSYSMRGIGSAANPTSTRLVGTGSGSSGDRLTWRVDLDHTALVADPAAPATITGGDLTAASRGSGSIQLGGVFTGGTITYDAARSSRSTCGDVVYDVVGDIALDGWTATFTVFLTQNRIRIAGRCLALIESASGAPGLTLTPVTAPPPPPPPATEPPPATNPPPGEF